MEKGDTVEVHVPREARPDDTYIVTRGTGGVPSPEATDSDILDRAFGQRRYLDPATFQGRSRMELDGSHVHLELEDDDTVYDAHGKPHKTLGNCIKSPPPVAPPGYEYFDNGERRNGYVAWQLRKITDAES